MTPLDVDKLIEIHCGVAWFIEAITVVGVNEWSIWSDR